MNLSNSEQNLTITAVDAVNSGFSAGIADNEEELAEFLSLPHWYETTNDGRAIHKRWQRTIKKAEKEIPELIQELNSQYGMTGDDVKDLQTRLTAAKELIKWWNKICSNTALLLGLPRDIRPLEEQKKTLEQQLKRARQQ